jgi:hypothetical protein
MVSAGCIAPLCRPKRAVKRKVEPRPGLLVRLIAPTHHLAQLLGDAEAEPGAAIAPRRRAVGLGEGVKNVPLLVGRDADPGIAHLKRQQNRSGVSIDGIDADTNLALFGELDRIAEQVGQDLPQASRIAETPPETCRDKQASPPCRTPRR